MADYIERQAAIDELKKTVAVNKNPNYNARIWEEGMNCAITIIGALPFSDVVEAIRCKDCIWYGASDELCLREGMSMGEEDYCSYAERGTDE